MIRPVVIGVPVALRALRLRRPVGPDVHPDATTSTKAVDITEVNPAVQIKGVGAEPYAWSVRLDPDALVHALPIARHHTIHFAESAIESQHAHCLRHDRVNCRNLTSVLVGFGERRERHELLTSIQKLSVQRGVKAEDPSPDDGAKVETARGYDWLAIRGNARHQLHPQMLRIGRPVVQNADQLSDGLIFKMTIVVAEVMCRENQRKISISVQKDRRWRDVIPILLIAVLERQAAEVAKRESLGGSDGLLRSQLDRHNDTHRSTRGASGSFPDREENLASRNIRPNSRTASGTRDPEN